MNPLDFSLLDFARGPALTISMTVFLIGTLWRLVGVLLLPWRRIPSQPRDNAPSSIMAALWGIVRYMWPHKTFVKTEMFTIANGYVFHLGLAIVVFLFAPHILFIKNVFGVSWPGLPSNVIYAVGVITGASLIAVFVHRLTNPVQKLISRLDDYISWALTFLPVATGLLASSHLGARYETILALHVLSICAFLIWFPFGKLMHAFFFVFSRGAAGVRFRHRGAEI